jgi:thiol-disulfide isomerase/thioredoxin
MALGRCALLAVVFGGSLALAPAQEVEGPFENAAGWHWALSPWESDASMLSAMGMVILIDADPDGATTVTIARHVPENDELVQWRPVAFDAERRRHVLGEGVGGRSGSVTLSKFRLGPEELKSTAVAYVGVEGLDRAGQKLVAKQALARAREAGVEVLPFPEVGQRFDFALTTVAKEKISSETLRGKVVLLDCWATWCTPCMEKMPELKRLYEKWHKRGFEVVGIGFDQDIGKAAAACEKLELPWPRVQVPADDQTRCFWWEATGIRALPRLLLIDRQGILQADCFPAELTAAVEKLMNSLGQ